VDGSVDSYASTQRNIEY